MKVIFTGTSDFAVPSLERVIASAHEVLAVITQPDKPKGRGLEMQISPIKQVALAHSIPVLQPEKIGAPESIEEIKKLGEIGTMIVVAYGQKIPGDILDWPKYGVVNVHGSILPKYRGAAPIQQAIIDGEKQTGVTTMLMDEGWDTGDILLQRAIDILPDTNAGDLFDELSIVGADLLVETLDKLEDGLISPIHQNSEQATLAKSLPRDAGVIDWSKDAGDIVNLVRGCTPRPGSFTKVKNTVIKVWLACPDGADEKLGEPGEVIKADEHGILVAAGTGAVRLVEIQPESRKRMSAADYLRGSGLVTGDRFDIHFEMQA